MIKMSKKILLVILIILCSSSVIFAQRYEPEELPSLIGDFNVSYKILNQNRTEHKAQAIDGIKIIRLLAADKALEEKYYTLYLYLDRDLMMTKSGIKLPYDFKWNFKGLSQKVHEFMFILKAPDGKIGVLRLDLSVRH